MKMVELTAAVLAQCRRSGWVISYGEVLRCGATSRQAKELVQSGVLRKAHYGIYMASSAPRSHGVEVRAALKALKVAAPQHTEAASHLSAAWLLGVLGRSPGEVHVTTTSNFSRKLEGVRVHRSERPFERRPCQEIFCTLPARTLLDLAATATPHQLADAVDRALSQGIVRIRDLRAEIGQGHRRGTDQLRRCLQDRGLIGAPSPSVLESRMARLITRFGLPLPKGEVVAGPHGEYRIDYANPLARLAVEVYGYVHHHTPEQMSHDHARQRRLTLGGWTVLIYTWRDVTDEPERVAEQIREAAARRTPT